MACLKAAVGRDRRAGGFFSYFRIFTVQAMATSFKQWLATDRLIRIFSIPRIVHPVLFDLFGLAGGYDGFWLDQEHGGLTYDQVVLASVCARANNFDCFVRLAPANYALVTQNLEAGAGGVMGARIESAAHAEEFVRWSKFAPRGLRGMNSSGRDANYTHKSQAQFAVESNRDHLVAIQIETLGALNEVDEIAAINGVDLLFVGPSDLSQELGILGQWDNEKLWEAIGKVQAACQKHGKHCGTVTPTTGYADRAAENGCRMLSFGSDVFCLRKGIEAVKQMFGNHFQL
jgi:2-dehydro-3-deoxyglucarate aldolase/4-hydroxy-2-oxoheptanedioate aldolase